MKTPASIVQRGEGKNRDPWLIRRFLSGLGLSLKDVAEMAQAKQPVVSDTVRGIRNHRRVLDTLERIGCPQNLLYPSRTERMAA